MPRKTRSDKGKKRGPKKTPKNPRFPADQRANAMGRLYKEYQGNIASIKRDVDKLNKASHVTSDITKWQSNPTYWDYKGVDAGPPGSYDRHVKQYRKSASKRPELAVHGPGYMTGPVGGKTKAKPAWMVKGSPAAKAHMAKLRGMRKGNGAVITTVPGTTFKIPSYRAYGMDILGEQI